MLGIIAFVLLFVFLVLILFALLRVFVMPCRRIQQPKIKAKHERERIAILEPTGELFNELKVGGFINEHRDKDVSVFVKNPESVVFQWLNQGQLHR